jgi:hypothetical protein
MEERIIENMKQMETEMDETMKINMDEIKNNMDNNMN